MLGLFLTLGLELSTLRSATSVVTFFCAFHLVILQYYCLLNHSFCSCGIRPLTERIDVGVREEKEREIKRMRKTMDEGLENGSCLWGTWWQEEGSTDKMKQLLTLLWALSVGSQGVGIQLDFLFTPLSLEGGTPSVIVPSQCKQWKSIAGTNIKGKAVT